MLSRTITTPSATTMIQKNDTKSDNLPLPQLKEKQNPNKQKNNERLHLTLKVPIHYATDSYDWAGSHIPYADSSISSITTDLVVRLSLIVDPGLVIQ